MPISRVAEHPRPDHVLFHFSDTHLIAGDDALYGAVDAERRLRQLLDHAAASRIRPTALVFTGDLTDRGEPGAYAKLRALVDPFAEELGAPVVWVMGNHDDRGALRSGLLGETASDEPFDRVHMVDGLRIVALDTSVPGHHYGEISDRQLDWLRSVLAEPAPFGTVLAMHHPPVPCVLDLAVTVELRDQRRLAAVLDGSDVRAILAGHVHLSTFATFAGIPVSVSSATCYTQDLGVAEGGLRGRDGAQAFNFVHVYPDTVVHTVVPIDAGPTVGEPATPEQAAEKLAAAGIVIPPAARIPHVMRRPPSDRQAGDGAVR
ncbi:phosphodiesterase [Nocardia puris]|uniref:3',5'-cyclic AMP phosphodiesterase CpdA n=1 Tax=Nocardia puris TaxID=208602 RepID=A0A366DUA2_9NOCA|nr:phosphodiesterase [Nocardia puris]MBF6210676.1 phosphodiesterase [Nocardia puris]MBF6364283.1 phosphodiesterase [Nocardia puris]MBF6459212.1 phosphodiesterase [Nocardia puris]RBO92834.1 3',5'-cyclic AMP phosphodiesterase CpdA [Nocardia puris]